MTPSLFETTPARHYVGTLNHRVRVTTERAQLNGFWHIAIFDRAENALACAAMRIQFSPETYGTPFAYDALDAPEYSRADIKEAQDWASDRAKDN